MDGIPYSIWRDFPHPHGPNPHGRGLVPYTDFEVTLARQILSSSFYMSQAHIVDNFFVRAPPQERVVSDLPKRARSEPPQDVVEDVVAGTCGDASTTSVTFEESPSDDEESTPGSEILDVDNPSLFSHRSTVQDLIHSFHRNAVGPLAGTVIRQDTHQPITIISEAPATTADTLDCALSKWKVEQEERELEMRWRATKRVAENWLTRVGPVRDRRRDQEERERERRKAAKPGSGPVTAPPQGDPQPRAQGRAPPPPPPSPASQQPLHPRPPSASSGPPPTIVNTPPPTRPAHPHPPRHPPYDPHVPYFEELPLEDLIRVDDCGCEDCGRYPGKGEGLMYPPTPDLGPAHRTTSVFPKEPSPLDLDLDLDEDMPTVVKRDLNATPALQQALLQLESSQQSDRPNGSDVTQQRQASNRQPYVRPQPGQTQTCSCPDAHSRLYPQHPHHPAHSHSHPPPPQIQTQTQTQTQPATPLPPQPQIRPPHPHDKLTRHIALLAQAPRITAGQVIVRNPDSTRAANLAPLFLALFPEYAGGGGAGRAANSRGYPPNLGSPSLEADQPSPVDTRPMSTTTQHPPPPQSPSSPSPQTTTPSLYTEPGDTPRSATPTPTGKQLSRRTGSARPSNWFEPDAEQLRNVVNLMEREGGWRRPERKVWRIGGRESARGPDDLVM